MFSSESLTAEASQSLGADARQKWEDIRAALSERSWQHAFTLADELELWLDNQGDRISADTKVQGLLILTDVAVVRSTDFLYGRSDDVSEALSLLAKAEAAAGASLSEETAKRLLRVRAKLTFITGKRAEAREMLDGQSDPGAISLLLGMMEEERQWGDASDLAAAQDSVHAKWASAAVAAHVKAGRIELAENTLRWAESQEIVTRKSCVLAYVKSRYAQVVGEDHHLPMKPIGASEHGTLLGLCGMLDPTFGAAIAERPSSGLDAEALEMNILLGHVLQDSERCQRAADQLVKWSPVMMELGRAVLRRDVAPVDGLADRFLSDHGRSYLTTMMAAMLFIDIEDEAGKGLDLLLPMIDGTDRKRDEEVATSVLMAVQYCEPDRVRQAHQHVAATLGNQHRLTLMIESILTAKDGSLAEARTLLAQSEGANDYIWLQLAASLASQQEAWEDVAGFMHELGELTGQVDAYVREAEAWLRSGKIEKAMLPLESAHKACPEDLTTVRNLSIVYHQMQRYADAVKMYQVLWEVDEHTTHLTVNYANALALSGDVETATAILSEHLKETGGDTDLTALMTYAHLLHSSGEASRALAALLPYWEQFYDNHMYLMYVMQLGYAAGREDEAQKALEHLVMLRDRGVLPHGALEKYTLDELRTLHQEWNERRVRVCDLYLAGKLPWHLASH